MVSKNSLKIDCAVFKTYLFAIFIVQLNIPKVSLWPKSRTKSSENNNPNYKIPENPRLTEELYLYEGKFVQILNTQYTFRPKDIIFAFPTIAYMRKMPYLCSAKMKQDISFGND